jgi:hypothetical protein
MIVTNGGILEICKKCCTGAMINCNSLVMSIRKHWISTSILQNSEKNFKKDKLDLMQEMRYMSFQLRKSFIIVSENTKFL